MLNPLEWIQLKRWFNQKAKDSDLTASETKELMDWLTGRSSKSEDRAARSRESGGEEACRTSQRAHKDTTGDGEHANLRVWLEEKSKESDLSASEFKELAEWLFSRRTNSEGEHSSLKVWLEEKSKESDLSAAEFKELAEWLFSRKTDDSK